MRTFQDARQRDKTFKRLSDLASPSVDDRDSYMMEEVRCPSDSSRPATAQSKRDRPTSTAISIVDEARKSRNGFSTSKPDISTIEGDNWKAGRQEKIIVFTLMAISFLTALDSTIFICALGVSI